MKNLKKKKTYLILLIIIILLFQNCFGKTKIDEKAEDKIKKEKISENIDKTSKISETTEKNQEKKSDILTEVKGLLVLVWEKNGLAEDDEYNLPQTGESLFTGFSTFLVFFPEDGKKYLDRALTVWPADINEKMSGIEMHNKILKTAEEVFKNIDEIQKKESGYIMQPVKLTLKPAKMYGGCCSVNYAYAELVKKEAISSTTVKLSSKINNLNDILDKSAFSHGEEFYQIYSKEGYTNVRRAPSKDSEIIEKIPNETYVTVTQDFGEWKYSDYFIGGNEDAPAKYGFIHFSQLKKVD